MWQKGKQIVEIDVYEVMKDLNSAYVDEWLAHYQYFLYAQGMQGMDAEQLKEKLEMQSADEMNHAKIRLNSRSTSKVIQPFGDAGRSHAAIWEWVQK